MALPSVSKYLDASVSGGPGTHSYLELSGLLYASATDAIIALASGGQTGATLLTTTLNTIGTVATIADSVLLPVLAHGLVLVVTNAASNSVNVFPNVGDSINALSANAAYAIAGGKTVLFHGTVDTPGAWHTLLTA